MDRRRVAGRLATALLAVFVATPALAIEGRVMLIERGTAIRDHESIRVWFEPATGGPPPPPITAAIHTRNRTFEPRVLHVPVGSTVRFPNLDPILHNVFSISSGNAFDVGLYRQGEGRSATFRAPGLVRVFCNVHRTMAAHVLVLATPHVTGPDTVGRFAFAGLPAGPGTLHAWHPRAERVSRPIRIPHAGVVELTLELTQPLVPPHLNKYGRPYRDDDDARDYR